MRSEKRKKNLRALAGRLDIPQDSLLDVPVLELHGNGDLLLAGCRNIAEYSDTAVEIMTGCGILRVLGQHLTLVNFSSDKISVQGQITRIELPRRME